MSIHQNLSRDLLVTLVETIENDYKQKLDNALMENKAMQDVLVEGKMLGYYACYNCDKWAKLMFNHCCFSDRKDKWIKFADMPDLFQPYANSVIFTCQYCNKDVCKACSVIHKGTPYHVVCNNCYK